MNYRLLGSVLALLLLSGCTAQIGYRYLDTFVEWEIEDYVELTDSQQQSLSSTIDEMHLWHARTQLPEYQRSLRELRRLVAEQQLTYNDIDRFENKLWQYWGAVQQRVFEDADLLSALSLSQRRDLIKHLQEKLEEQREEEAEESESPLLEQIDRVSRREERIKEWTGSITKEQQRLVRQWVQERPEGNYWLAYRQRWNDALAEVILAEPIDMAALKTLIISPRQLRTQQHKNYTEQRTAVRHKYLWKIYESLTPQQREKLLQQADEYLQLLDDLIADFAAP